MSMIYIKELTFHNFLQKHIFPNTLIQTHICHYLTQGLSCQALIEYALCALNCTGSYRSNNSWDR